jgi:NodT family efflux transporter outer membrane factor (OMF) lipoprotein
MTQKINKILYLVKELKLWARQKNFYQLSLPRSVHRPVTLLSKAWQFILSLSKDRTLVRSVILFNGSPSWSFVSKDKVTKNTENTQRTQSMFRKLSIAYCLLLIVLASCSLGKQYQQPVLELPKQFNNVSYADTSSIADIQWREFFTDATLQALIDKGLTYNHDLLMATKRIGIAQQRLSQSKLLQLPELNLQFTAQYSRPSNNSLNGISIKNFLGSSHVENYSTQVSATWEADIWGKIRGQKEIVLAEYLQTYEARKAVQTQLVADIAQGYFNLLMLDKQLDIARKNLGLSDSFLVATRLLKDAGVVNLLAVEQAESQKQSTALLVPQLQLNIALQENALQVLTGQLPGAIARSLSLNEYAVPGDLSAGLPAAMVSRRPDVRANEMALIAATSRIGVAQANMYPALNITLGGGLEAFKASNWFNIPNSLFGLVAGSIAQPILRRKELRTQYEIAKIEREEAVIQFKQSVLQATAEVSNALIQIDKLKEQQQIATAQVDTLQQAVFNSKLLFRSDLANYLEVLTAQGNALQAQLNLAAIQREKLNSVVELYRALGGGWK